MPIRVPNTPAVSRPLCHFPAPDVLSADMPKSKPILSRALRIIAALFLLFASLAAGQAPTTLTASTPRPLTGRGVGPKVPALSRLWVRSDTVPRFESGPCQADAAHRRGRRPGRALRHALRPRRTRRPVQPDAATGSRHPARAQRRAGARPAGLQPGRPRLWHHRHLPVAALQQLAARPARPVLYDQRGTGYIQPALACPEVIDYGIANLDSRSPPRSPTPATTPPRWPAATGWCRPASTSRPTTPRKAPAT